MEDSRQLLRELANGFHLLIGGQVLTDVFEQNRMDGRQTQSIFPEVPLTESVLAHVRELARDGTLAPAVLAGSNAALGDRLQVIQGVNPEITDAIRETL